MDFEKNLCMGCMNELDKMACATIAAIQMTFHIFNRI